MYCVFHAHQAQQLLDADRIGKELTSFTGEFRTATDLNRALGNLFKAVAQNRIPPKNAAVLAYIGQLLCQTIPNSQKEIARVDGQHFVDNMIRSTLDLADEEYGSDTPKKEETEDEESAEAEEEDKDENEDEQSETQNAAAETVQADSAASPTAAAEAPTSAIAADTITDPEPDIVATPPPAPTPPAPEPLKPQPPLPTFGTKDSWNPYNHEFQYLPRRKINWYPRHKPRHG
jgi:chemotaxis protein histidine kinase CheA